MRKQKKRIEEKHEREGRGIEKMIEWRKRGGDGKKREKRGKNWEIRREKEQKWNRAGEKQSRVNNYVK